MSIPPPPSERPRRRQVSEPDEATLTRQLFAARQQPAEAGVDEQATEMLSIAELSEIARESHAQPGPAITPQHPQQGSAPYRAPGAAHASAEAPRAGQAPQQPGAYPRQGSQPHGTPSQGYGSPYPQAAGAAYATPAGGYPTPPGGYGQPPSQPYPAQPPEKKGRIPGAAIAALIIAALLVISIVGFIIYDSARGPSTREAAPPPVAESTEAAEPSAAPTSAQPTAAAEVGAAFTMPSGNISCVIDSERVRCHIKSFDYDPGDAPDNCSTNPYGSVLVANNEGAGYSCDGGLSVPADAQVLDYGQSASAFGTACKSSENGVECTTENGKGFQLARAAANFM